VHTGKDLEINLKDLVLKRKEKGKEAAAR